MKKKSSALLVIAVILVFFILINVKEVQPYSTESVLDATWDKFGLVSYQIGATDPIIWIEMDETKSEKELRKHLDQNLSRSDLNHYSIEVTQRNIQKLEQEHQELLESENN